MLPSPCSDHWNWPWGSSVLGVARRSATRRAAAQIITHGEDVEIHALHKQGWSISLMSPSQARRGSASVLALRVTVG